MKLNDPIRIKWDIFIIILSIWNSFTLPLDIAFNNDDHNNIEFFKHSAVEVTNHVIDCLFLIDIFLNFRTTYQSSSTGDEIQRGPARGYTFVRIKELPNHCVFEEVPDIEEKINNHNKKYFSKNWKRKDII